MEPFINDAKDEFLRFLTISDTLSYEDQNLLYTLPIFKSFSKGSILFKAGERTSHSYFILKGGVRTYKLIDGKDITLEFYLENEAFAPPSTILRQPSSLYAVCFEDTVMVVSTEEIEEYVIQRIPVFQRICRKLSEKLLAQKQERLEDYKTLSPEESYQQLVKERPELLQRVPQYQIASYLGIRPESLSRIRSRIGRITHF
jgi:CRP-like cAMP-binding protein